MSFGQRSGGKNRKARAGLGDISVAARRNANSGNGGEFGGVLAVVICAIAGVGVTLGAMTFVTMPIYTYKAPRVNYSRMDMGAAGLSSMMIDSAKAKVREKHGVDFSVILTPSRLEQSERMKHVARQCLPRGKYYRRTMLKEAHRNFGLATDYLLCAMAIQRTRLCESGERARLADQLSQYLTLRQQMFGIERANEKMVRGNMAQYTQQMFQMIEGSINDRAAPPPKPKIGAELDSRIATLVRELVAEGYLFASDFSWLGLAAPGELAYELRKTDGVVGRCS